MRADELNIYLDCRHNIDLCCRFLVEKAMEQTETWKPIVGYEGLYEVSSKGSIRRVDATVPVTRNGKSFVINRRGHIMKPCTSKRTGYMLVQLSAFGKVSCKSVHVLVCEAFHGPRPIGFDCAHLDGTRTNNASDNLSWVSKSENQSHRVMHGTDNRGENAYQAKLNEQMVLEVRRLKAAGKPIRQIATDMGITYHSAYDAASRRSWSHIP